MAAGSSWFAYTGRHSLVRWPFLFRLRRGGFRSHLNLAGWAAVVFPGVVVGLIVGSLAGRSSVLFALASVAVTWSIALGLDHLAWHRRPARPGRRP